MRFENVCVYARCRPTVGGIVFMQEWYLWKVRFQLQAEKLQLA
jgi:hypothetical protein